MHPEYERSLWTIAARSDPSGYLRGMIVRRRQATAALVVAALLTSGCGSPAAPPTPDPTASSSSPIDDDAAAFAAAEATYRAYVDALNAVDLSDPATFEPVYALTTGEMRATEESNLVSLHTRGVTKEGQTDVLDVIPDQTDGTVATLFACLDVSRVTLLDRDGSSLVEDDRADVQQFSLRLERGADGSWLLNDAAGYSEGPAC